MYRFAFRLKGGPFNEKHEFRLESNPHLMGDTMALAARDLLDFVAILMRCPPEKVAVDNVSFLSCWRDKTRLEKQVVQETLHQRIVKERERAVKERERREWQEQQPNLPIHIVPPKRTLLDHRKKVTVKPLVE